MKYYLIVSLILIAELLISKPYEPQAKGGFSTCIGYEIRTKTGKFDEKAKVKTDIQTFDKYGNAIKMISYSYGKEYKNNIENKYNEKGLLIETKVFDPTEKYFSRNTYEYDENNNRIADTSFSMEGEPNYIGTYKYDKNNFLIEESHAYLSENKWTSSPTYYLNDEYGNKLEESSKHSSTTTLEVAIDVDLGSNTTQSQVNKVEEEASLEKVTYKYKYNDKKQVIWSIRYGIGGTKLIHSYKYDDFGNIIEEITYDENDESKPLLKRIYEYKK